ncbi:hydantoinase B/oxoprolinase family protein [Pseudorhodoplanes sp.]|uniref:hydantoinase B/oxoprolinase family protein n=1 Tax=Pseudorhodoplanes sp. TaxID=1934341 RepID=UPI003D14F80E
MSESRVTPAIDPITLEVVRNKLEGIAEEMQQTLLRSSFSPIVKEGLDASASLFTLTGETLAQACAIPVHLGTLIPVVATVLKAFPPDRMQPGDAFIMNDPYLGGTHLPDIAVIRPIFSGARPIALSATMTHHQDVGGLSPGSVPTNATEIFQEGLRIPPLLLCSDGQMNETLIAMIRQNVRIPDTVIGDLNAQIAACNVGVRRLSELAALLGHNALPVVFETLLARSETMTREALRKLPEGTYRYVDFNDNDGIDLDRRIRFEVAVTIRDGQFDCDFTGSSDQVRGPFNCVPSGSLAAACFAIRAITDPAIPSNAGCFRPITLNLPKGSIVNPVEPAAVNARTATIKRITGTILGALRPVIPDRIPADASGEMLAIMFGGKRADGTTFVTGEMIAGGSGAGIRTDGVDVIETDVTNCMNLSAEAMEMEAPIRVHRIALKPDSGGAGRQRGGLGIMKEYEILQGEVRFTHRGERHYCAAGGSDGGGPGGMAESEIRAASGEITIIPSKLVTTLQTGDRVVISTAGGGGNGNPAERDRQLLGDDVSDGKVSAAAATELYS